MSKTRVVSLKDLLYIEMGQSPKAEFVNVIGKGVPLLNGPAEFTTKHPVPKQYTTKGNRFSEELDILFCVRGSTTGRMNIADQKYAIGRGLAAIRHLEGNQLNSFVRGLIEQNLVGLLGGSMGSVFPNLTKDQLLNYKCVVPELKEQYKIAKVLSDLDAKIELNNKINTELEAMAKLIYDYWFVQFDFPDKNGKPYKSSGGKMVFNEELKREIPEGWEAGELIDIANITMGQSPPGDSYNEEGVGDVFYQGCTDFGSRFPSNRKFTTKPSRYATKGDILLSVRAPVGTMNIANENCCIGRGLASLNSKDNCISYLDGVLQYMKQIFDRRNSSGTTFGSITKGDLFSLSVVIPNEDILKRFDAIAKPMFDKQNLIGLENQKLSELRDWLLPMLMNGQVTVGEAEEILQNK